MKKIFLRIIKVLLLFAAIIVSGSNSTVFEAKVSNDNINKIVNLTTMAQKVDEFDYNELYGAKDTFTGDLTGYVYNCPLCTGALACMSNYNIKDGTITYPDEAYGEVNIVASSSNLPCGSIIRFESSRISSKPVFAIVLDRGVLGNAIDFLSENEDYAVKTLGRSSITYDVLRFGW